MACDICGCTEFGAGPGGRMSRSGLPPRCTRCQSLERHRVARAAFDILRDDDFKHFSVLQFSQDRSAEPSWFASHEVSVYGGKLSLDLQKIDRPDDTYDMVICNHVIEHVPDDAAAMRELVRVIKPTGFVFLTFPDPANIAKTNDWGFPRADQHDHYRIYGRDVEDRMRANIPNCWIMTSTVSDPVTGVRDLIYLLSKTPKGAARSIGRLPEIKIVTMPELVA